MRPAPSTTFELHIYRPDGRCSYGLPFRHIAVCEDETGSVEARRLAERAMRVGKHVVVLDESGDPVFEAVNGEVLYPANVEDFWREAGR